jgi:hypothetical protein
MPAVASLLKQTVASDANHSVTGKRIASRGTAASWEFVHLKTILNFDLQELQ